MKVKTTLLRYAWVSLLFLGCPGPEGGQDSVSGDAADAVSQRSYLLGGEAVRYEMSGGERWVFDPSPLQIDGQEGEQGDEDALPIWLAEVVVLPAHLYGVPWSEFGGTEDVPSNLPGSWVASLQAMKSSSAGWDRKTVLALMPTNSRYDNLAPRAKDDGSGQLQLEDNWLNEYCPNTSAGGNPSKWPSAYARYVKWMVALFEPDYVLLSRRINLYEENCGEVSPGSYESMVSYSTAANEALKAANIGVTTVVSVDVEDLYGYPRTPGRCPSLSAKECFETRRVLMAPLVADRIGLASYPAVAMSALKDLPDDWLKVVLEAMGDTPAVFTGLGLPAVTLEQDSGVCVPLIETDESTQREFLEQALVAAEQRNMEIVVWTSGVDYLPVEPIAGCNCSEPKDVCTHLGFLGASADAVRPHLIRGLFDASQNARQAGDVWQSLLEQ
jgi:hypothetical protein